MPGVRRVTNRVNVRARARPSAELLEHDALAQAAAGELQRRAQRARRRVEQQEARGQQPRALGVQPERARDLGRRARDERRSPRASASWSSAAPTSRCSDVALPPTA